MDKIRQIEGNNIDNIIKILKNNNENDNNSDDAENKEDENSEKSDEKDKETEKEKDKETEKDKEREGEANEKNHKAILSNYWSIIFRSLDSKINTPMTCHHSQTFRELVENLYEEFKELKEKEIFFTCGGLTMDLDKDLEENKIKNKSIILINYFE